MLQRLSCGFACRYISGTLLLSNSPDALALTSRSPSSVKKINIDFIKDELPFKNLSGILMVNSLHYVEDKNTFLLKAKASLVPDGHFIIVEYDTDEANRWVPYPVSFSALHCVFEKINFHSVQKLQTYLSRYWQTIYSALIKRD